MIAEKEFLSFSVAWHRQFYLGNQFCGLIQWGLA